MSDDLTLEKLDELEQHFEKQLKDDDEREALYTQQADEIAGQLAKDQKVNDGYYTWAAIMRENGHCTVVAARNMLMFKKGYTPMFGQFELNKEISYFENLREVVKIMLKRQNGEYVAEEIE